MRIDLYWIALDTPGKLTIMPRPRGGDWLEDELTALVWSGVGVVISLLTPSELAELGLEREAAGCDDLGLRHIAFPIPDRSIPASMEAAAALAGEIAALLRSGTNVVIHCRIGIGRSAVVAGCVLVSLGASVGEAFERIGAARGQVVPDTEEQRVWLEAFARRPGRPARTQRAQRRQGMDTDLSF
jgi:protein-tyrosine phosphatase